MDKSHVGMGYHVCPVCCVKHDEVVLLDKHLRNSLERDNFVGFKVCDEHKKLMREGYVALVELDVPEINHKKEAKLKETWEYRTGQYAFLSSNAFTSIFNQPIPEGSSLVFVDKGFIDELKQHQQHNSSES